MVAIKIALICCAILLAVASAAPSPGFFGKHEHHTIHVPYKVHTVHHHHVKKVPIYKEIVKEVHVPVVKEVHVPVIKEVHVPVHHHHDHHDHHDHHEDHHITTYHHKDAGWSSPSASGWY